MNNRIKVLFLGIYLLAIILVTVQRAQATLGESIDSIETDRKAISAVWKTKVSHNGYTVQELYSEANVVKEYISSSGVVFAVAWKGLSHPDLSTLLGTYLDEYQQALSQISRQKGKRHFQVKANRVIVEKWGHMRNMQGRAFIPALIPSGVSIDEIK